MKLAKECYYTQGKFYWTVYEEQDGIIWKLGRGESETYLDAAFNSSLIFKEYSSKREYKVRDYDFSLKFYDKDEEKFVKKFLNKFHKSYTH